MRSRTEQLISFFSKRLFSSEDPRTPSLASMPGRPLSYENEILILDTQERNQEYIQDETRRSEEERRRYWTQEEHLVQKLESTVEQVSQFTQKPLEEIEIDFAIVKGTGQVVVQQGNSYHYVELCPHEPQPVYISDKATLPESEIPHLVTLHMLRQNIVS